VAKSKANRKAREAQAEWDALPDYAAFLDALDELESGDGPTEYHITFRYPEKLDEEIKSLADQIARRFSAATKYRWT
jgi:hypothetical protein